jgi:hypothetical protein
MGMFGGVTVHNVFMRRIQQERHNKIQNYSHNFSMVDEIPDISVASDFTTHK